MRWTRIEKKEQHKQKEEKKYPKITSQQLKSEYEKQQKQLVGNER